MKLTLSLLLSLSFVSLVACSKKSPEKEAPVTSAVQPLDLSQLNLEAFSPDGALTLSEYVTMATAFEIPRACGGEVNFKAYQAGDNFSQKVTTEYYSYASGLVAVDYLASTRIEAVQADALKIAGSIDNYQTTGFEGNILASRKIATDCLLKKGQVACETAPLALTEAYKTYEKNIYASVLNKSCKIVAVGTPVQEFAKGLYTLEQGSSVKALVAKVKTRSALKCPGRAEQELIITEVTVSTDQLKSPQGLDCAQPAVKVYDAYLIRSTEAQTLYSKTEKVLSAPLR